MKCSDVESVVGAWEAGRRVGAAAISSARGHLASCPSCAERFDALFALIELDEMEVPSPLLPETPVFVGFSDRVLGRIEGSRRNRFPIQWIGLAAAMVVLVMGVAWYARAAAPGSSTVSVLFVLDAPSARSVSLVGDFNKWNPAAHVLRRSGPGKPWELRITLPKGKMYVYDFVIDGEQWVPDPAVQTRVDDGFGGSGSLLRL